MINSLPAVILAGGLGSRLGKNPHKSPKVLSKINGKPFLFWKLISLANQNVNEVYLLLGKGAHEVVKFLNNYAFPANLKISCILDGPNPLGTGGAIKSARNFLPDQFLLTYGDNLLDEPLLKIFSSLNKDVKNLIVATTYVSEGDNKNLVLEADKVKEISKTSKKATHTDYGYSILSLQDLPFSQKDSCFELNLILNKLAKKGKLHAYITDKPYYEIGTPTSLQRTENWAAQSSPKMLRPIM